MAPDWFIDGVEHAISNEHLWVDVCFGYFICHRLSVTCKFTVQLDETEYDCVTAGCVMSTFCLLGCQSSTQHDCIAGPLQRVVAPGSRSLRAGRKREWEKAAMGLHTQGKMMDSTVANCHWCTRLRDSALQGA